MGLDLATLFGAGIVYLLLLFLLAHAADTGRIAERWINNPWTYTLSLGVYATSWSFYGSVGFAAENGFLFLTIYLGVTLAFLLGPVLLEPILRLTREFQLASLADLFAFRYRSQWAGVLVTLFMLMGALPYIALQIRAVTESLHILTAEAPPGVIALGYCVLLTLFAILFGARHVSPREKHHGLVLAIAFESLVKLIAMLLVGLLALFQVFDGASGLQDWLSRHPQAVTALYQPVQEGPWSTLLFLSFCAAFLLPRQYHMIFSENLDPRHLRVASWAFPLFLLVFNLAIPIVLWAGQALGLDMAADYYVLGVTLARGPDWLSVLAFLGGLSAATAMVIVTTLALSSMTLNNLLLPANYPDPEVNLYRWLLWGRRILIAVIILAGLGFYSVLEHNQSLVQLGLISFVAVAQFLPGIIGLLVWRRANRTGFVLGLLGGMSLWFLTLLLPLLESSGFVRLEFDLNQFQTQADLSRWEFATFLSLLVNGGLFVLASLFTRQSAAERSAAEACCSENLTLSDGVVAASSPNEFRAGLARTLGPEIAEREVGQALSDLRLEANETRPAELRRLRERIERNLSGLLGPQLAHMIVRHRLRLDSHAKTALADSMRYVEERLAASHSELRGLNATLDNLRRFHRQILQDLPLGVCALESDHRIVIWNTAMAGMTGIDAEQAAGKRVDLLPPPWSEQLGGFARAGDTHRYRMELPLRGKSRWFNLHKAAVTDPGPLPGSTSNPGMVMLLEDLTDLETLEAELAHSDRLASIGRLAAGVAHEIGNPVTGIASIAQNLQHEHDAETLTASIEDILTQTRRITDIVRSLGSFSRGGHATERTSRFAISEMIQEAVHLVRLTPNGRKVEIASERLGDWEINGDRQQLTQVLVNLLKNAADASKPGDRIDILVHQDGVQIYIEILDQGAGIPPEHLEMIFEPFFTTKPTGQGTGLGLALAYKMVQDHGGTLEIDSQVGIGTRMVVALPIEQKPHG